MSTLHRISLQIPLNCRAENYAELYQLVENILNPEIPSRICHAKDQEESIHSITYFEYENYQFIKTEDQWFLDFILDECYVAQFEELQISCNDLIRQSCNIIRLFGNLISTTYDWPDLNLKVCIYGKEMDGYKAIENQQNVMVDRREIM